MHDKPECDEAATDLDDKVLLVNPYGEKEVKFPLHFVEYSDETKGKDRAIKEGIQDRRKFREK